MYSMHSFSMFGVSSQVDTGLQWGWRMDNLKKNQGEENRWVFREVLKVEKVGCWRTERGSLFQECGPETEKARGPKVLSFVLRVRRMRGSEAERRVREGVYIYIE